jgi:2-oxoglutarate dehydrogenase E1 component
LAVSFFSTSSSAPEQNYGDWKTALMREDFRRHGYKLANINPLHPDGFLADACTLQKSLPTRMKPIVSLLQEHRTSMDTNLELLLQDAMAEKRLYHGESSSSLSQLEAQKMLEWCLKRYCHTGIGWEVEHCISQAERDFFDTVELPKVDHEWVYEQLLRTQAFAELMSKRYSTGRRFGIEGLDAAVPALKTIVNAFGDFGNLESGTSDTQKRKFKRIIVGTQHRGRLDFLHHVLQVPLSKLIAQWDVTEGPSYDDICSGYRSDVETPGGNKVHLAMIPIPAHLEAMDAVISGKARAHAKLRNQKQGMLDEDSWMKATQQVLPLSVHGDASVCGQGVVAEALHLGTFSNYDCGGTIHIVLNNQIGFTTETGKERNPRTHGLDQVSDIAKSTGAPVLHINARHVEEIVQAATIAVEYRQHFGKDIWLNLWGWRLHGHNELDDPLPTNVSLYSKIERLQEPIAKAFLSSCSGVPETKIQRRVQQDYDAARKIPRGLSWKQQLGISISEGKKEGREEGAIKPRLRPKSMIKTTAVAKSTFEAAAEKLTHVPEGFTLHSQVERVIKGRKAALFKMNGKVDWATAELLALATLSLEGIQVRLSGEDVQRGTFSQRQAVWHDKVTGEEYHPLAPSVEVCNSPLSELGVMGFEYGFSVARPADSLVLWEAQFGDFVNGAQVLLDTVFAASEEKWKMQSGLTVLLPHGYDGMGPEHSSARLERWLQLFSSHINLATSSHDNVDTLRHEASNMSIAYPTEPSNYFHLLRRQLTWHFRRPLVVLTPKRTLRVPQATSKLSDFVVSGRGIAGSKFRPVLDDPRISGVENGKALAGKSIQAIILCSGEIYYDICGLRNSDNDTTKLPEEVAVLRLEELAPFPSDELRTILDKYVNAHSIAWVQEEPSNQGALDFVVKHLQQDVLIDETNHFSVSTCSRPEMAAPAVGHPKEHFESQENLMSDIVQWARRSCQQDTGPTSSSDNQLLA